MDMFRRLMTLSGTVCVVTIAIFSSTMIAEGVMDHQNSEQTELSEWDTAVLVFKCALIALIFIFFIALNCTDCYNSEVSTECHPAAAGSGPPKWGGAGGYTAAASSDINRSVMESGFAGEVVHLDDVAPLPYALIPAQVPESQGFRGYGPVEPEGTPLMGGYGSSGMHQSAQAGYGGTGGVPQATLAGYGGTGGVPQATLAGYGGTGGVPQSTLAGYGGTGGVPQSTLAGYGGTGGVPQATLAGYGGTGGVPQATLSGYGGTGGVPQAALAGYGGGGGGQWVGQAGGGGPSQWRGSNPVGGRAQNLPGAHVPLMTPESEDPPPPYFAPSNF